MTRPNLKKLQKQCDDWNAQWPIGSAVICTKDDGERLATVTTSEAQVLSGHTAVIWMKDIRGCYLLDRVKIRLG
jgi:hypothetical protein